MTRAFGLSALVVLLAFACHKSAGGGQKGLGEACADDDECAQSRCQAAGGFCTKPCTADKDCAGAIQSVPDAVCRQEGATTAAFCAKKVGADIGSACAERGECNRGMCLHRVGEEEKPGICSGLCQTAKDCPPHFQTCVSIDDSAGIKLCLPDSSGGSQPPPKFGKKGKKK